MMQWIPSRMPEAHAHASRQPEREPQPGEQRDPFTHSLHSVNHSIIPHRWRASPRPTPVPPLCPSCVCVGGRWGGGGGGGGLTRETAMASAFFGSRNTSTAPDGDGDARRPAPLSSVRALRIEFGRGVKPPPLKRARFDPRDERRDIHNLQLCSLSRGDLLLTGGRALRVATNGRTHWGGGQVKKKKFVSGCLGPAGDARR